MKAKKKPAKSRSKKKIVRTRKTAAKAPAKRTKKPRRDDAKQLALDIAQIADERNALDIQIIEVRGLVDYTDFVVVMSGRSDRQITALARSIEEALSRKKVRCLSIEGLAKGVWVLMDLSDVVVHIFHEQTRHYYDIDSLWMDAKRITPRAQVSPALRAASSGL